MAISENTKSVYNTAKNMLDKCSQETGFELSFPLNEEKLLNFIGWNLVKGLSAGSIKSYLSGLKKAQAALGYPALDTDSHLIREVLQGQENMKDRGQKSSGKRGRKFEKRLPVTLNTLKWLKAQIRNSKLSPSEKIATWGICTLGFYGSLRLGEILCKHEKFYDPKRVLLIKDIEICKGVEGIEKESVQFLIKSGKTNKSGKPETIVVYATGDGTCPVRAVKKMLDLNRRLASDLPFFSVNGSQPVTQNKFNEILKMLTHDTFKRGKISGHSFRSGIPSMLA